MLTSTQTAAICIVNPTFRFKDEGTGDYAANIIILYFMDTVFILPHRALLSSNTLPLNARVRFEIL